MRKLKKHILLLLIIMLSACSEKSMDMDSSNSPDSKNVANAALGKLFIIGGGKRPPELIQSMLEEANLKDDDYILIIPSASSEPDSACYYSSLQFKGLSDNALFCIYLDSLENKQESLDSIANARLIYMSGGDQRLLMRYLRNEKVKYALWNAYQNGATLAGTSAGAAVMSEIMITGDQHFVPEYSPTFDRIQKGNLMVEQGLGFLNDVIIDQHFIVRSRYNRMFSALLEYPDKTVIGIDESTALIVSQDSMKVSGKSQVVVAQLAGAIELDGNSVGMQNIEVNIYKNGDHFTLNKEVRKSHN
jgi:cyanophycinase